MIAPLRLLHEIALHVPPDCRLFAVHLDRAARYGTTSG
jgi:hypothetical protein